MLNLLNILRWCGGLVRGWGGWWVTVMTQQITLMIPPPIIVQLKPPAFHIFPQFIFHIFHTNLLALARRNTFNYFGLEEYIPSKCFCHCYFHCHWPCHCHLEHHRHPLETVSAPGLFNSSAVSGEPSCCERRHHANKISRLPPFSLFYI